MAVKPIIDPEFKKLLLPLDSDERTKLYASLDAHGCRDPIVLWKGHNTIIDGHNRFEYCEEKGIHYETVQIVLPSREAVIQWISDNQLGRRNCTDTYRRFLLGAKYNAVVKPVGAPASDTPVEQRGDTAEKLGAEANLTGRSVRNAANFNNKMTEFAKEHGEEALHDVLSERKSLKDFTGGMEANGKPDPEPEDEAKKRKDETAQEAMDRVNKEINSLCTQAMKLIEGSMPDDKWIEVDGGRESIITKFRDGCTMLRRCKCVELCPACGGEKKIENKKCKACHGTGRVTKERLASLNAKAEAEKAKEEAEAEAATQS